MSKAIKLIEKLNRLSEISYLGQYNDYSKEGYERDAGEYHAPFSDLQLPDKDGSGLVAQTKKMDRKSKIEDRGGNKVK